ncbi:DUF6458 family protein [Nocardiopsis composta]
MGIGLGIFLVVIGAVLTFGITAEVAGLDLDAIGMILMAAGAAVVVISIILMITRRDRPGRASATTRTSSRPHAPRPRSEAAAVPAVDGGSAEEAARAGPRARLARPFPQRCPRRSACSGRAGAVSRPAAGSARAARPAAPPRPGWSR